MEYVRPGQVILLQIIFYALKCASIHIDNIPICSSDQTSSEQINEIHLTAHGIGASVYVLLRDKEFHASSLVEAGVESRLLWPSRDRVIQYPPPQNTQETCRLKVTAPPGHVVYINVLETRLEIHRALIVHQSERDVRCQLNIFLPNTKSISVYTSNMCDVNPVSDVPLLPSELELSWKPPIQSDNSEIEMLTRDRMLLLTAVGKDATCRSPAEERNKYHTCMNIGWEPILCVSKDLVCNGQKNCPKGSTSSDEAESICRPPQSFEDIARKLMQEFQFPLGLNDKWVENAKKQVDTTTTTETSVANKIASILKKSEASTRKPVYHRLDDSSSKTHPASTTDSNSITISTILNQYGPWGYLLLGMLICGGILLLCGMWDCCCRRPKPFLGSNGGHRNGGLGHRSSAGNGGGPTVLIINAGEASSISGRPPEYDDLDQPPLYSALFPNNKVNNDQVVAVIQMQERRPSQEEEQQSSADQQSHLSRQNSTINPSGVHENLITTSASVPKDDQTTSQSGATVSNNINASENNIETSTTGGVDSNES